MGPRSHSADLHLTSVFFERCNHCFNGAAESLRGSTASRFPATLTGWHGLQWGRGVTPRIYGEPYNATQEKIRFNGAAESLRGSTRRGE
ncbi:conserved protein of unknown function [Kyrpidia spormannii]|uniref:Uncharacterized protein n=2 Tax=Kyrpidia spormannii TaxID=2055160 RepID=A0ACA8ZD13_9BACL|nr:conserved protein of unknown function [Kyrpidia spormannii]CAB3395691.1 conserved protein of unknown function [Kyrpidia spormannii]